MQGVSIQILLNRRCGYFVPRTTNRIETHAPNIDSATDWSQFFGFWFSPPVQRLKRRQSQCCAMNSAERGIYSIFFVPIEMKQKMLRNRLKCMWSDYIAVSCISVEMQNVLQFAGFYAAKFQSVKRCPEFQTGLTEPLNMHHTTGLERHREREGEKMEISRWMLV